MSFPYKNPISSLQVGTTQSVPLSNTYGLGYSVNNIGGYMEVYSLNDLIYTIPTGTTGSIEYSGNTIPIEFTKGNGNTWSPDVLVLASDNISSGRRRLGMLVYVYEEDQVYQFHISGYTSLFTAATASTNCVTISEYGTLVKNNTPQGRNFINAWTASTIEDVSGYTSTNATWRKFNTGTGGSGGTSNLQYFVTGSTPTGVTLNDGDRWFDTNTGVEVVYINDGDSSQWIQPTQASGSISNNYLPLSGGTVTGGTIFQNGLTANTISATTYYNLPQSVSGTGIADYVTKWDSTGLGLTGSQIYDGVSFVGIAATTPVYGEFVGIFTENTGVLIDDTYIIQTVNGSLALATGGDYSVWASSNEVAIGTRGPLLNSGGAGNIGIGDKALASNTTGINNIAIGGTQSLLNNIDGSDNISIGLNSLQTNISGANNIALGSGSLFNNLGNRNIGIGTDAGAANTTNDRNVYIGFNAGFINDGSSNIFIGDSAGNSETTASNKLIIGDTIYGDLSSKLIGINQTNPITTLDVSGTLRVSDGLTANTISATTYFNLPQSISGSGTSNYIPKWTGTTGLGDSLIYDSGTNIGIGTSSPSARFDIQLTGGTIGVRISGDSSSDMLRVTQTGAGNAIIVEDSLNPDSTPFVVTSGGTVGIGVTNPNPFTLNQADGKLHVRSGNSGVTGGTGGSTAVIEAATTNYLSMYSPDENVSGIVFGSNSDAFGSFIRWGHDQGRLQISTANSNDYIEFGVGENLFNTYITTTGFGINTLPTQSMHVSGNTLISGSLTATTISATTQNISGTKGQVITDGNTSTAFITISGSNTVGGASYVDFLRVTNNSVGATNPTKTIRVNNTGGMEFLNSVYTAVTLTIADNGILYLGGGGVATVSNNDATSNYLSFNLNNSQIYDDGNTHIHSRGAGQSMWINTNGGQLNLLTQSPTSGGSIGSGIAIATGSLIGYVTINTGKTYTTSASYGYLVNSATPTGQYPGGSQSVSISLYATARIWAQEFDAFSDERMKDIQGTVELDDALKLVNDLKPIKYTWKEGEDKGLKVGYSAQQVSKAGFDHLIGVLPKEGLEETIDEDGFVSPKDTQFSMNYEQVTPYHGVVIKHLLEEIKKLKEEIKELKSKVG